MCKTKTCFAKTNRLSLKNKKKTQYYCDSVSRYILAHNSAMNEYVTK